jgi:hypothetical protein
VVRISLVSWRSARTAFTASVRLRRDQRRHHRSFGTRVWEIATVCPLALALMGLGFKRLRGAFVPHANASPASVNVGAMVDGRDDDATPLVVDPIDDAEVASAGCVVTGEFQAQLPADPPQVGGQTAVDELDDRIGHPTAAAPP